MRPRLRRPLTRKGGCIREILVLLDRMEPLLSLTGRRTSSRYGCLIDTSATPVYFILPPLLFRLTVLITCYSNFVASPAEPRRVYCGREHRGQNPGAHPLYPADLGPWRLDRELL